MCTQSRYAMWMAVILALVERGVWCTSIEKRSVATESCTSHDTISICQSMYPEVDRCACAAFLECSNLNEKSAMTCLKWIHTSQPEDGACSIDIKKHDFVDMLGPICDSKTLCFDIETRGKPQICSEKPCEEGSRLREVHCSAGLHECRFDYGWETHIEKMCRFARKLSHGSDTNKNKYPSKGNKFSSQLDDDPSTKSKSKTMNTQNIEGHESNLQPGSLHKPTSNQGDQTSHAQYGLMTGVAVGAGVVLTGIGVLLVLVMKKGATNAQKNVYANPTFFSTHTSGVFNLEKGFLPGSQITKQEENYSYSVFAAMPYADITTKSI